MKNLSFLFPTLSFTLSLFHSLNLYSNDFKLNPQTGKVVPSYAAELKFFKGSVKVKNQQGLTTIKEGARFNVNDIIITEDKSVAKIQMVDDSVFTIGSNSEVKIEKMDFTDKTDRTMVITFLKGQMRSLIKNKVEKGEVVVKTNLAVMGIRGTEFMVNHRKTDLVEVSELGMLEGKLELVDFNNETISPVAPQKVVLVKNLASGEGKRGESPLSPEEISSFKNEEAFMDYYHLEGLKEDSPFYELVKRVFEANKELQKPAVTGDETESNQKNWQDNLHKLNEKLKKYRK